MAENVTNGMLIVDRIDNLLKKKGINRVVLAEAIELKPQNISAWSTRGTIPAGDICLKIADYLGVSVEWLISGREGKITEEELKLLKAYCKLDSVQKDTLWTLINKWLADYAAAEKKENPA